MTFCNSLSKDSQKTCNTNKKFVTGFTLLELMIGSAVLIVAIVGALSAFTGCFTLNETAKNLTIAINGCQEQTEEIFNTNFSQVFTTYNGAHFEVQGLASTNPADSEGAIEIDNTNPNLLEVRVSVSWRQKGGMIIGEDTNLNGNLDAGEDTNLNGHLDSPAQIITLITRR